MARALSPIPTGAVVNVKTGAVSLDWSRWFQDVYNFLSRVLNRCDADRSGTATLVTGTVTVPNTRVTSSTLVRLTAQDGVGTPGHLSVSLSPGVGFTINSTSGTDARAVFYELVEVF